MKKIILFIKFLRSKNKDDLLFRDVSQMDLDKYEKKCLALGMWAMFKAVHIPEFLIGLDSDADALLDQYLYEKHKDLDDVEFAKIKVGLAKSLVDNNKNIYKFFAQEGLYTIPSTPE